VYSSISVKEEDLISKCCDIIRNPPTSKDECKKLVADLGLPYEVIQDAQRASFSAHTKHLISLSPLRLKSITCYDSQCTMKMSTCDDYDMVSYFLSKCSPPNDLELISALKPYADEWASVWWSDSFEW